MQPPTANPEFNSAKDVHEQATEHEYAFDCTVVAAIRIRAASREAALAKLALWDAAACKVELEPGRWIAFEASVEMAGDQRAREKLPLPPAVFEIDGASVESAASAREASSGALEACKWYVVTGRIHGDDEDTAMSLYASSRDEAVEQFKLELLDDAKYEQLRKIEASGSNAAAANRVELLIYVNSVFESATSIEAVS